MFDAQKQWYVFGTFQTNVRNDIIQNSWTPTNLNAKYPRVDESDTYSSQISSYYLENGSYVRLRNLQLGYTIPQTSFRFLPAGSRLYVQAENLFTITGYEGLDPALRRPTSRVVRARIRVTSSGASTRACTRPAARSASASRHGSNDLSLLRNTSR